MKSWLPFTGKPGSSINRPLWKLNLIEQHNPLWEDLYEQIAG